MNDEGGRTAGGIMDDETLIINGLGVDRRLLEAQPARRCDVAACRGLCCSHGVWVDVEQKSDILRHADLVRPHLPAWRQDEQLWFCDDEGADADFPSGRCDATSMVIDLGHPRGEACIFLRPDARCALQVASTVNGLHRWALKPFFCALYPLVICQGRLELDGENELYQAEACRSQLADSEHPLYLALKDELVLALGEEGHRQLCRHDKAHLPY